MAPSAAEDAARTARRVAVAAALAEMRGRLAPVPDDQVDADLFLGKLIELGWDVTRIGTGHGR